MGCLGGARAAQRAYKDRSYRPISILHHYAAVNANKVSGIALNDIRARREAEFVSPTAT